MNRYALGQPVRIEATFRNSAGQLVDPEAVIFATKDPAGDVTTLSGEGVTKDSVGAYHVDVVPDAAGEWHYRALGSGTNGGAAEGSFLVVSAF